MQQEPFVESRQLTFAQLLGYLDESEEREEDDQQGHELDGLLSGKPSGADTGGVTGELYGVTEQAARVKVSQGTADSKVSHRAYMLPTRHDVSNFAGSA
jgi:hypothetical protein